MLKIRFFLLWGFVLCLATLFPSRLTAAPVLQTTYSEGTLQTDEFVVVEAVFSWPKDDGPYYFFPPEWKLENLAFRDRSRTEDTFSSSDGRSWQRVIFHYKFKPVVEGKALIGYLRFAYLCAPTQETGTITVVRQMEYRVRRKRDYLLMLTDMLCLMSGMLFAASLIILLYTRHCVKREADRQRADEIREFQAIPAVIEKTKGSQKEQAFEWANQFKLFLVYHYKLAKTVLTEREAVDVSLHLPDIPAGEAEKISGLSDRLFSAQFSSNEWDDGPFERLRNDLLDFIRRRM